jgi:hypothetical protein
MLDKPTVKIRIKSKIDTTSSPPKICIGNKTGNGKGM